MSEEENHNISEEQKRKYEFMFWEVWKKLPIYTQEEIILNGLKQGEKEK